MDFRRVLFRCALLLPGRGWWDPLVGAGAGLLAVGGLLGATWSTYDIDAFGEPSLSGELQRAPGLLRAVERNLEGINQVRDRVDAIRSEEHTSELQSLMRISYAVFCLKKKTRYTQ